VNFSDERKKNFHAFEKKGRGVEGGGPEKRREKKKAAYLGEKGRTSAPRGERGKGRPTGPRGGNVKGKRRGAREGKGGFAFA